MHRVGDLPSLPLPHPLPAAPPLLLIFCFTPGPLPLSLCPCRPTVHRVGDLQEAEAGYLQPEFSACTMHLGGDVDPSSVFLLHSVPGLPGSQEVIPGLYVSVVSCRAARRSSRGCT